MDVAVKYYKDNGQLNRNPLPLESQTEKNERRKELLFPGKVCVDDKGEKLFVADSSNHRILVVDLQSGKFYFQA